jgi:hypothetical protein
MGPFQPAGVECRLGLAEAPERTVTAAGEDVRVAAQLVLRAHDREGAVQGVSFPSET